MSDVFKIPKDLPANTWIKIVNVTESGELIPCSGGNRNFRYKAPKKKLGVWAAGPATPTTSVQLCYHGYHVTRVPNAWSNEHSARAFWAKPLGYGAGNDTKTAFSSIQLLRPVQLKDFDECGMGAQEKLRLLHAVIPGGVLRRVLAMQLRQLLPKLTATNYESCGPYRNNRILRATYSNCLSDIYAGKFSRSQDHADSLYEQVLCGSPIEAVRHLCHGEYRIVTNLLAKLFAMIEARANANRGLHSVNPEDRHYYEAYELIVNSISGELRNAYGYDLNYDKPLVHRKNGKFYPAPKRTRG